LERISNTTTTAGTSVGKYKSSVSETVVKVTVSGLATIPQADETVSLSSLSDDAFSIGDVVVAGTETGFVDTTIKLKTIDDRGIANMNVLTYDGDDYTITGYELPDLVFYSGSTETVKKIDPISVGTDTENTKYFSITSIKAL
jgi:6-phosphogluconate dehydrogenase (decarboxylating)